MARESYRADLDALRATVRDLGDDVVAQLESGLDALADGDAALAREVIAGDDAVDERYLALEADCIDLFALQQPVASDLRLVAASFKIGTDLERIGDLATNLAEYGLEDPGNGLDPVDVRAIGDEATAMVEAALDAYDAGDPAACRAVAERDDDLDALCMRAGERVVRDLLGRPAAAGDGSEAPDASEVADGSGAADRLADAFAAEPLMADVSRALLTVRDLERVGDHAVNVAARTLYVVDSDASLI